MLSLSSKITQRGVLAHLVERNTGSVEVSGSSPLYSTKNSKSTDRRSPSVSAFFYYLPAPSPYTGMTPHPVGPCGCLSKKKKGRLPTTFVSLLLDSKQHFLQT